jgi:hypothetical protein
VLSLFRLIGLLLALPFLTATATVDLSSALDPGFTSLHKLSIAEAKLGSPPMRSHSAAAKHVTAELEDGPEGEDTPIANLLRAYDGDDQIETRLSFAVIAFRVVVLAPSLAGAAPVSRHFPCAGFPTGPPAA